MFKVQSKDEVWGKPCDLHRKQHLQVLQRDNWCLSLTRCEERSVIPQLPFPLPAYTGWQTLQSKKELKTTQWRIELNRAAVLGRAGGEELASSSPIHVPRMLQKASASLLPAANFLFLQPRAACRWGAMERGVIFKHAAFSNSLVISFVFKYMSLRNSEIKKSTLPSTPMLFTAASAKGLLQKEENKNYSKEGALLTKAEFTAEVRWWRHLSRKQNRSLCLGSGSAESRVAGRTERQPVPTDCSSAGCLPGCTPAEGSGTHFHSMFKMSAQIPSVFLRRRFPYDSGWRDLTAGLLGNSSTGQMLNTAGDRTHLFRGAARSLHRYEHCQRTHVTVKRTLSTL